MIAVIIVMVIIIVLIVLFLLKSHVCPCFEQLCPVKEHREYNLTGGDGESFSRHTVMEGNTSHILDDNTLNSAPEKI